MQDRVLEEVNTILENFPERGAVVSTNHQMLAGLKPPLNIVGIEREQGQRGGGGGRGGGEQRRIGGLPQNAVVTSLDSCLRLQDTTSYNH